MYDRTHVREIFSVLLDRLGFSAAIAMQVYYIKRFNVHVQCIQHMQCKEPFVDIIKVALKVTRLYFMVIIHVYDFITSKTL